MYDAASGIIPARAGFTSIRRTCCAILGDHPRSRGVYNAQQAAGGTSQGSSPLARGLRAYVIPVVVSHGIIPARAGFTTSQTRRTTSLADHPRSRGVYPSTCAGIVASRGSSPLARGLRRRLSRHALPRGIIPARAGFTHHRGRLAVTAADHPRSRGVYTWRSA